METNKKIRIKGIRNSKLNDQNRKRERERKY